MLKSNCAPIAVLGGLLIAFAGLAEAQPMNVFRPPIGSVWSPCTPEPGWWNCFVLADPKITIMSLDGTSEQGRSAVANIYEEITKRFSPKYPRNKFDCYKIYLTNGKPWSALANLKPIGQMWPAQTGAMSGDSLRGGTNQNFLWIDEQMICKTGIKTNPKDAEKRTFDQVIHEFAHAISFRYGLGARIDQTLSSDKNFPAAERWAWSVQGWFSSPARNDAAAQQMLSEMFTSKASFSCQGYKP